MKRLVVALLAALLLAGCGVGSDAVEQNQEFQFVAPGGQTTITYDPPADRRTVSGLRGDSLLRDGATVGLDDYAGRVVVVNIWGSWCGPCREEVHELQAMADQLAGAGVTVLGVDIKDSRTDAADFLTARGIRYDSIFDPAGRSLLALKGFPRNVVPSTLVFDRQHRVAAVYLAAVKQAQLRPLLDRLAAEPGAPAPG
ncbi:TlpA family protein disulfide reductase [Pseudonocardia sp. CA-107938]|uniref:TlpA family protein disulfide reductase n=1 Tax=Pseudonocardia sp. CA-107938 TaxID=3240021 RepID=UPI003D8F094B